ncbi:TPA: type VI secretion system-associated FHA domain protein TagH [Vibrio vulnificus]
MHYNTENEIEFAFWILLINALLIKWLEDVMGIVFSITSFHRFTPEIKSVYSIPTNEEHFCMKFGRSESCDWVLPDPERIISGVHGEITKFGNDYLLRDLSTNGIFVNKSVSPVGNGIEVALNDKDVINFGDYEIEVSFKNSENHNVTQSHTNTLSPREVNKEPVSGNDNFMDFGFDANLFLAEEEKQQQNLSPELGDLDDFLDAPILSSHIEPALKEERATDYPRDEKVAKRCERVDSDLNAFLKGAGIDLSLVPEQEREQWFNRLGRSYSLMLEGLMQTLHNRAEFKQANKLNHTSFQKKENNPLKFSANLEDAIHNLYNRRSASFLSPEAAIQSAFNDIEAHEKAMIEGVHGAVSGVLRLLEPNTISGHVSQSEKNGLTSIFSQLDKKRWKKYENIYFQIRNEIDIDEKGFYLEDFSKSYESAIRKVGRE